MIHRGHNDRNNRAPWWWEVGGSKAKHLLLKAAPTNHRGRTGRVFCHGLLLAMAAAKQISMDAAVAAVFIRA